MTSALQPRSAGSWPADPDPSRIRRSRHARHPVPQAHRSMVATTANAKNRELVMSLGADQLVDYSEDRLEHVVEPCDLVFDRRGRRHTRTILPGGDNRVAVWSRSMATHRRVRRSQPRRLRTLLHVPERRSARTDRRPRRSRNRATDHRKRFRSLTSPRRINETRIDEHAPETQTAKYRSDSLTLVRSGPSGG